MRYRLQENQKLSKKEMRELNALLMQDPNQLRTHERERMIQLAEATGVDLSGIVAGSASAKAGAFTSVPSTTSGGSEFPPPPPEPFGACAADEEFLRERRAQRLQQRTPPPPTYEDLVEEDGRKRRLQSGYFRTPEQISAEERAYRTRSIGTQVEMLKEMPKVVFVTPSGTYVHATKGCSTVNRSTKFLQKEV